MENASKALIIAGAILLSIAIIGIGMFIYKQAADQMSGAGSKLSAQQIDTFNAEYLAYEGTQKGSMVKTLCNKIRTYNTSVDDAEKIGIISGSAASATSSSAGATDITGIETIKTNIKSGSNYKIDFGYDAKTGRIVAVGISQ